MKAFRFIFLLMALAVLAACGSQKVAVSASNGDVNSRTTLTLKEKEGKGYSNIFDYLRAKVPGLSVSGDTIVIRGIGSINSQGSPLILVDGADTQDISSLRPDDVESVEVIKDSGAAIYGFRGAAGVIKITTKAGKNTGQTNL